MSVIVLLSLLTFLGSASSNTDSRKPINREASVLGKITAKRSVSFQHGRQELISIRFFKDIQQTSLQYSVSQHERLLQRKLECHSKKFESPEIQNVIQLHAPRSADQIAFSSRG